VVHLLVVRVDLGVVVHSVGPSSALALNSLDRVGEVNLVSYFSLNHWRSRLHNELVEFFNTMLFNIKLFSLKSSRNGLNVKPNNSVPVFRTRYSVKLDSDI